MRLSSGLQSALTEEGVAHNYKPSRHLVLTRVLAVLGMVRQKLLGQNQVVERKEKKREVEIHYKRLIHRTQALTKKRLSLDAG